MENFPTLKEILLSPEVILTIFVVCIVSVLITHVFGPIGICISMIIGYIGGAFAAKLFFYRRGF